MRQRWKVEQILKSKSSALGNGVYIKPDLSHDEHSTQSHLLKERRTLINAGIDRSVIRIRQNRLTVNDIEYGYASPARFHHMPDVDVEENVPRLPNVSGSPIQDPPTESPPQTADAGGDAQPFLR